MKFSDSNHTVSTILGPEYVGKPSCCPTINSRTDLSQNLLLLIENEARWTIENDILTAVRVPDFLGFLDTAPLKRIKPQPVEILKYGLAFWIAYMRQTPVIVLSGAIRRVSV